MALIKYLDNVVITEGVDIRSDFSPKGYSSYWIEHIDLTDTGKTITAVAATDLITVAAYTADKFPRTGLQVQFTTTTTLPAPLALVTNYYCIATGVDGVIKIASSLANAKAGIAIDLTDAGTGTHTMTPTAGTRNYQLYLTMDKINYYNVIKINAGTATTIALQSITSTKAYDISTLSDFVGLNGARINITMSSGQARMLVMVYSVNPWLE